MAEKVKEFTTTQSINLVKEMLGNKAQKKSRDKMLPGDLFFAVYDAKFKEETYNKRPFIMLLKQNKTHMLGIAFSWAPMPLRIVLVKKILQANTQNLKLGRRLEFSYEQLKPFLKKIGMAVVVRRYIRKRMSSSVSLVKPENLMIAARLKSEVFTNGKISAEELYKRAIKGNIQYRKTRKRRE